MPVVLRGRVEDAVSGNPIVGVRVLTADSSRVVVTDSLGAFALPLEPGAPFTIYARRLGYLPERFDLDDAAPTRTSVLLLEPNPIPLAGIEALVVNEADAEALIEQVGVLEQRLADRRNASGGPVISADRIDLERFAVGSALDFVRSRSPMIRRCWEEPSELCVPGRSRSFRTAPERRVTVCVDERRSYFAESELGLLPVQSVASVEVYGGVYPGMVRVYTDEWMLRRARTGRTLLTPLIWGCLFG